MFKVGKNAQMIFWKYWGLVENMKPQRKEGHNIVLPIKHFQVIRSRPSKPQVSQIFLWLFISALLVSESKWYLQPDMFS